MRVIGFALIGEQQDITSGYCSGGVLPNFEQIVQFPWIFIGQTDFVYQSHTVLLLSVSIPQGEAMHQLQCGGLLRGCV